MIGRYKVITLIGSTRFKEYFEKVATNLTLNGYIVLPLTAFSNYNQIQLSDSTTEMLKDMIRKKIDISDEVYVVNPDGYIDEDTMNEIEYTLDLNKKVTFMSSKVDVGIFKYYK